MYGVSLFLSGGDMSDELTLLKQLNIKLPTAIDTNQPFILVEPQQDLRLIVAHHLLKCQFRTVVQARNGVEAIEKMKTMAAEKRKAGFIMAAWDSPLMGAADLLNEIKQGFEFSRPTFMVTQENVTKEKLMLAVEQGVDEVIAKPFTLGDIMPKIRNAFRAFNNASNPEQLYELAKDLLRKGAVDQAGVLYQKLAEANVKSARPLTGLAKIAKEKKQYDVALKHLNDAEQRNPNFVHLYALRGEVYTEMDQINDAITAFQKGIDLSPLNPIRYLNAAELFLKINKFQEVVDLMKIAQSNELKFSQMYKFLSQAYFNLKNYPEAVEAIRTALAEDPENTDYINQYAISLKSTGNFDEAIKAYNKIIKIDQKDPRPLYNKAILFKDMNKIDEAVRILEKMVERFPEFEPAKHKLQELNNKSAA
jgi:tetratricopeptide (TPR) repeat protein